jgi:hypothetical protein
MSIRSKNELTEKKLNGARKKLIEIVSDHHET